MSAGFEIYATPPPTRVYRLTGASFVAVSAICIWSVAQTDPALLTKSVLGPMLAMPLFAGFVFAWFGFTGTHTPKRLVHATAQGIAVRPFGILLWSQLAQVERRGSGRSTVLILRPGVRTERKRVIAVRQTTLSADMITSNLLAEIEAAGYTASHSTRDTFSGKRQHWDIAPATQQTAD